MNKILVFGGEYFDSGGGVFSDIYEYSIENNSWKKLNRMNRPRHGTETIRYNNKIYIPGGANQMAFAAVLTNEVFSY